MFGRCDSTYDSMSSFYADVTYRRCHVSIRQTGFPRTPSRPMSPYGGGFGRFGGRTDGRCDAIHLLLGSLYAKFQLGTYAIPCTSSQELPSNFACVISPPQLWSPFSHNLFHEISVSSEFYFDISAPQLCLYACQASNEWLRAS